MAMGHGSRGIARPAAHDDALRIEVELFFEPRFARRVHHAAALLGGVRRPFLRVILRRLKNRQSVPMATATPRSFNPSRSSASVTSDFAAKAERISSAWASIRCEWRSLLTMRNKLQLGAEDFRDAMKAGWRRRGRQIGLGGRGRLGR